MRYAARRRHRLGLTLLELLVVLMILAVLTTMALTTTETVIDQARFDATQRTLRNIEDAILGPSQEVGPDGSQVISGFVADNGRLPNATLANPLEELLYQPADLPAYGLQSTVEADGRAVTFPGGWRGPYLRLSAGTSVPVDGWGRPIAYSPPRFFSYGADGVAGNTTGSSFAGDLSVSLFKLNVDGSDSTVPRYLGAVIGQVQLLDNAGMPRTPDIGSSVVVRLYGPGFVGGFMEVAGQQDTANPQTGVYTFAFSTFIGPRVVRAYEGIVRKSRLAPVAVPVGGTSVNLTIQKP